VNAALVRKTVRDTLPLFLLLVAAIVIFETLFMRAMSEFAAEITEIWFKQAVIRRLIQTMLGADLAVDLTATGLVTVGFAHPLLYAFTWTFLLATITRALVAEVERGTADLLLTLPVARWQVYTSISVVWVLVGPVLSFAPLLGLLLGEKWSPLWEPLERGKLVLLCFNLLALYLAIGGCAMLVSSLVSRRGHALAILLGGLLASLLINFLSQFWSVAERFGFLGILHYYRPLPIIRSGDWPTGALAVLAAVAILSWFGGLWRFVRRDIPAV